MPDHLLHGKWRTRVIRANGTIVDGDLELNITPPKTFVSGKHKGNKLKCNAIDDTTIELEEIEGTMGTLKVAAAAPLPDIKRKGFIGSAKFPDPPFAPKGKKAGGVAAPPLPGQNDGVWVGTQP